MILRITDNNSIIDSDFANWLLDIVKTQCGANLRRTKLEAWSTYLTESPNIPRLYSDIRYDASKIIIQGIQNLTFRFTENNSFDIYINPNVNADGYNRFNLESACKLINYGNTQMQGFPIFTTVFTDILLNLRTYIYYYYGV